MELKLEKKLDPQLKANWINALRNGDYLQAKGTLYEDTKDGKPMMCCLGVLEHICGTPVEDMLDSDLNMPDDLESRRSPEDVLKQVIRDYEYRSGAKKEDAPLELVFADINDNFGTFEEISNIIEENL